MPGVDRDDPQAGGIALSGLTALTFGGVEWLVPGLLLTVPGTLIVLVMLLQAAGALVWVPVARRRLGRDDAPVRRVAPRGPVRL
jgi:hypothetical protein